MAASVTAEMDSPHETPFPCPQKEQDKILRACKEGPGPGFLIPPGRTEKEGYEQPLEPCGDTTESQTNLGPPNVGICKALGRPRKASPCQSL